MKRLFRAVLCALLFAAGLQVNVNVHAEPDYTDTGYWAKKCADYSSLTESDITACKAYVQYQISRNNTKLKEIEEKRSEIAANIQKYAALVQDYQAKADAKQGDINAVQAKINDKQAEIDAKQAEINATQRKIDEKNLEIEAKQAEIEAKIQEIEDRQAEVDAIQAKLRERMVTTQPFMRVNRYLDILMGAESFAELLRMTQGMIAISEYDNHIMDELLALIDLLNQAKAELEQAKAQLEEVKAQLEAIKGELTEKKKELEAKQAEMEDQKKELVAEQSELLNLKYEAQVIEEEYRKQKAELEAQGNRYAANIKGLNDLMKEIAKAGTMDKVKTTGGWTFPVPGSRRSAGTWYYPGGGVHLGYDFAAPIGTNVYAVGNGIVINRADGCPYGYLGSSCGSQYGGSSGGGNQVYLLTVVNGSLYAVKYLHLLAGTPIRVGTVVNGGDIVARLGSSGNSSGPHCHIEIFYLGDGKNFSHYAQTWNGDLAFGCGWGYSALSRRCESGVGAPCRIRPESVFN